MSLISPSKLKKMNYVYQGQPFVDIVANGATFVLYTMDYAYQCQPFVTNCGPNPIRPFVSFDAGQSAD